MDPLQGEVTLSVVVPVYSGETYLRALTFELDKLRTGWRDARAPLSLQEVVFVDDESIDGSAVVLEELEGANDWVRVVTMSRNFGQHPATIAGILHSAGDWVVTLDEDLQHPPAAIPELVRAAVRDGADIVYGKPADAVHGNWLRDLGSRGFKSLMRRVSGNQHIPKFNSFRLMRGAIARAAASICAHDTYFDIALCWFTNRVETLDLQLKDRRVIAGERSGYSLRRLMSHARRMAMSSHTKVLRVGGAVGLLALLGALVLGVLVLVQKIFSPESIPVQGWASLLLVVLTFGGITSLLLAFVIEYLLFVSLHAQGKPTYFTINRRSDQRLRGYFEIDCP